MDFKDLGKMLAGIGLPLLGAALPIPGGAAIATALAASLGLTSSTPEAIATALDTPEARQKAFEFQATHTERMLELTTKAEIADRQADSADIASVNATMIAELQNSANEDRVQRWWRPFNGYVVGAGSFISVVGVLVLFYAALTRPELGMNVATVINVIPQLAMAVATILAVPGAAVGITAWHRGVKQRMEVTEAGKSL